MMATAFLEPVGASTVVAELSFYESLDGTSLTVLGVSSGMTGLGRYRSWWHEDPEDDPAAPDAAAWAPRATLDDDRPRPSSTAPTHARPTPGDLGIWKGRFGALCGARRTLNSVRPTGSPGWRHLYEIDTVSIHRVLSEADVVLVARGAVVRTP